jgi:SP family arabinose:H+ symporter-like MFS transporter
VNITWRIVFSAFTAALAGFLFGFDTVVISGAEQKIQSLWSLSPAMHGIAMGSALYGTVVGSLCGGWPTDRFGRRATLRWIGILYLASAVGAALAANVYELIVARWVGGLGIGISTVAAPLYIAEIAPARYRGRLAGLFQFNIVLGIVIAYVSNSLLADVGENAWRWMMGVAAFPSLLYAALCLRIAESPRWLLDRTRNRDTASAALRFIYPRCSQEQLAAMLQDMSSPERSAATAERFWTRSLRAPILLALMVALFNQLSGINAILYFAPRIFRLTGLSQQAALLQSVGIGVTNLIFTFIGLWLIDRVGRRTLLFVGSLGYIFSLSMVSWAFFTLHYSWVPACIFIFIAAHAVGQGAVIWVLISEIFPTQHRAQGQTLGSFTHWAMAALVTSIFPSLVALFAPGYVFAFFCAMMILQLIWVKTMVVETKGLPLEAVTQKLKRVWYSGA